MRKLGFAICTAAWMLTSGGQAETYQAPNTEPFAQSTAAEPTLSPDAANPRLKLLGSVINGSEKIGVFERTDTKELIRLRLGGSFDGWSLQDLGDRAAHFESPPHSIVLYLNSSAARVTNTRTATEGFGELRSRRIRKRYWGR